MRKSEAATTPALLPPPAARPKSGKHDDGLNDARAALTKQVLDATTLEEVTAARFALQTWIEMHPQDQGMSDAFEQLAMMEEIALLPQNG